MDLPGRARRSGRRRRSPWSRARPSASPSRGGDIRAGAAQGLFFRDTRFLSGLEVRVNGAAPEPLAAESHRRRSPPPSCSAPSRGPAGPTARSWCFRYRYVGRGMREDLVVRNFGEEAGLLLGRAQLRRRLRQPVRGQGGPGSQPEGEVTLDGVAGGAAVRLPQGPSSRRGAHRPARRTSAAISDDADNAAFEVVVPARGTWQHVPAVHADDRGRRDRAPLPLRPAGRARHAQRAPGPVAPAACPRSRPTTPSSQAVVARSAEDLGALRIFDPDYPERAVVAAGAPWFMTLFGRDSLLTSWMALLVDPDLALGVLQTLARFQGTKVDPRQRRGARPDPPRDALRRGAVAVARRRRRLLRHGRRHARCSSCCSASCAAGGWPPTSSTRSCRPPTGPWPGSRSTATATATATSSTSGRPTGGWHNQGWKDSWDAIRFADGRLARAPIALCEVQGYVYGAYLARAYFADEAGDEPTAARYRAQGDRR